MPNLPADLPTDVAELQAMVMAQRAELAAARAGVMAQRYEIEQLKARLAKVLRQTYGMSSEKLRGQVEQLELRLADIEEQLGATERSAATTDAAPAASEKPKRKPLPAALPRQTVEHAAPCACPACGDALRRLGEDVTEVLDCAS